MFFVEAYNPMLEEFELIGAFSKREEADAFALERKTELSPNGVYEAEFRSLLDRAVKARLGVLGKVFEAFTKISSTAERLPGGDLRVTLALDTSNLIEAVKAVKAEIERDEKRA